MRRHSAPRRVASLILFTTAGLKVTSLVAGGQAVLLSPDPVLDIPTWLMLLVIGAVEFAMAALLVGTWCDDETVGTLLLWFIMCSVFYRIGHSVGSNELCPCLGLLPKVLFWSTQATNLVTLSLLAVLALTGFILLRNGRRLSP